MSLEIISLKGQEKYVLSRSMYIGNDTGRASHIEASVSGFIFKYILKLKGNINI